MPCTHCCFALVFSRLERGPDPLVLSQMIVNWLLNPTARFEMTFSTPDTFHEQILTEIYDKTRVYWRTKAEFRFFLIDFVPFLKFRIGMGHVAVTIKILRDWLPVVVFSFSRLKSLLQNKVVPDQNCVDKRKKLHPLFVQLRQSRDPW